MDDLFRGGLALLLLLITTPIGVVFTRRAIHRRHDEEDFEPELTISVICGLAALLFLVLTIDGLPDGLAVLLGYPPE